MRISMMPEVVAGTAGRFGAGMDDGVTGRWGPGSAISAIVDSALDDGQVWHIAAWAGLRQMRDDTAAMARDAAARVASQDARVAATLDAAANDFVVNL